MIKNRQAQDNKCFSAFLTDLFKVLTVKYSLPCWMDALCNCLFNLEETKNQSWLAFSDYLNILSGVPHGSMLNHFFDLYTCDMFFFFFVNETSRYSSHLD